MTLTTRDFSTSSGTEWVIDIPTGTVVDIDFDGLGWSGGNSGVVMHLGDGGTKQSINYRYNLRNATLSNCVDVTGPGLGVPMTQNTQSSGVYGAARVYNMNTLAPVTIHSQTHSHSRRQGLIFKSAASWDQLIISLQSGGTINAGTIRIKTYDRTNVVYSKDFGASSANNFDLLNLAEGVDDILVLSSYDLVIASSQIILGACSIDNGTNWDKTSGDYRRAYTNRANDDVDTPSIMSLNINGGTTGGLCCVVTGVPQLAKTMSMVYPMTLHGTGNSLFSAIDTRQAVQIENAFQIAAGGGALITDGTIYAVGYAMK